MVIAPESSGSAELTRHHCAFPILCVIHVRDPLSMSSKLNSRQRNALSQLRNFTGATEKVGIQLLSRNNWSVEVAAEAFFAGGYEASSKQVSTDKKKINEWFDALLKCNDEDTENTSDLDQDAVVKFCEDIGVDPMEMIILGVSFKMNAANMCTYTRAEFTRGMEVMGCDTPKKMQAYLPKLRAELAEPKVFREFYNYCFTFAKEEDSKVLSQEIAIGLWQLLLADKFSNLPLWIEFLEWRDKKWPLSKDTWSLLLEFSKQVNDDLSKYDDDGAWPVIIDDFVDWLRDSKKK